MTKSSSLTEKKSEIICSLITAIFRSIIIQPFDFLRIRIQTNRKNRQIFSLLLKYKNNEGMKIFMKGFSPTLVGTVLSSFLHFESYQRIGACLRRTKDLNPTLIFSISGFASGMILSLISTPIDNIRVRLNSSQNIKKGEINVYHYNTPLECMNYMYKNQGIKGFYSVFPICLLKESLASCAYFTTFEMLKKWNFKKTQIEPNLLLLCLFGSISGINNWLLTLPIDNVKAKLISDKISINHCYNGVKDCVNKTYNHGGVKAFYKGISLVMIRAVLVNGPVLACFDLCRKYFIRLD